ncbi:MAG: DNA polymerase III subunit beta [Actinomycetota bacterium]|nr:DNA polymerase III subunit beta [Actinomycetota bacterium]
MIVSVSRENLNRLVQTSLRAVSTRVTMPVLTGLLMRAEGKELTVAGTDLEMSIRVNCEANIEEEGLTVVSGRLIGDIVKNVEGESLLLRTEEKYLVIKSTSGEFRLREMLPEDFPQVTEWDQGEALKVSGNDFTRGVQQTARASSNDEKRPVLTGTLMEKDSQEGLMRLVSTDSYRLSMREIKVDGSMAAWDDSIVPSRALSEVSRICGASNVDVQLKTIGKVAVFSLDETVVSTRLIEGQFPNYKQLVPSGGKTVVNIQKEAALQAIKRAIIFGHNLRVEVGEDRLSIMAETPEVGNSSEVIPASVEGDGIVVGFNGSYLVEGIGAVDGENVLIYLEEPQKPALIKGEESDKFKYVLMPVRLR